ncbi:MAG: Fic family protein [Reichenbachiella sp.]|uniref:Fic family protein n=1 Tax=Reichenbachiella sp. TaxID=2184521 RepID=UPI00326612E4
MEILPASEIRIDYNEIQEVQEILKSTFRIITFSREHLADDLLNTYLESTTNLQELLSIKNAQMEAQNDEEIVLYERSLNSTLAVIIEEIKNDVDFTSELQLFQLLRSISPESHLFHPNRYRDKLVRIGNYICPEPDEVSSLVSQLFHNMNSIQEPLIRAIYFHHELIRIHPFSDGNGRTTRIAKNWILMYNLYPPIFVRDAEEKREYIDTLSNSFSSLEKNPGKWNSHLEDFFHQELRRIKQNASLVYESVKNLGESRNQNE